MGSPVGPFVGPNPVRCVRLPGKTHGMRRLAGSVRRWATPKRLAIAAVVAVVLVALSPAVQGYHIGYSRIDTTCTTRLLIQFCKNEHARLAREQAGAEARECRAEARRAEEGKSRLLGPSNYYWRCLRPGAAKEALIRKWEGEREAAEHGEQTQTAHHRAQLESEASVLKAQVTKLSEEQERLLHESKITLSVNKGEEATQVKREAEKKLEEAKGTG